jgi:hypothetical protein
MSLNNRQLTQLAQELTGRTSGEVNAELQRRHIDFQSRIAVKVQIDAMAATGRTVHARGLATDTAAYRPLSEMDRLLRRAGLRQDQTYTEAEIETAARGAEITDPQTRLALKLECSARGMIATGLPAQPREVDRVLMSLAIDKPITLTALEDRLDRHGIGSVALRTAVRAELQQRGLLAEGGRRSLRASAAPRGLTLRSWPE